MSKGVYKARFIGKMLHFFRLSPVCYKGGRKQSYVYCVTGWDCTGSQAVQVQTS